MAPLRGVARTHGPSGGRSSQRTQNGTFPVARETGWVLGGPKGAAVRLGMKRSTLHWKMKKLGISRPE